MNKENFKKRAQKSLNDLFSMIDELEAKKDKVKADSKAEYDEKISMLKSQKDNLQAKYNELIKASDEKWGQVKNTFSDAADSFKEGLSKISSLF